MRAKVFLTVLTAAVLLCGGAAAAAAAIHIGESGWWWGNPLPQGNDLLTLDAVGTRVYAGGGGGTLLRSDDGGETWQSLRPRISSNISLIRATSEDSFVFTDGCALRKSDDGGRTFRRLAWVPVDSSCDAQIRSFHFPSANVGYVLLSDGAVFTTTDGGESWSRGATLSGSKIGDIWFTADGTGVTSINNNVYRTTDHAASWTLVSGASTGSLWRFSFAGAADGFVVGNGRNVLKTTDGGVTWSPVPVAVGSESASLNAVDCVDALTCVAAAGDQHQIFSTTDGGVNWSVAEVSARGLISGVGSVSSARAVAIGFRGATMVSDDTGVTWRSIDTAVDGKFYGIKVESGRTAYAYGLSGALARTKNGGINWSKIGVASAAQITDVSFPSDLRGYVLAAPGTVLHTENAGASWRYLDFGSRAMRAVSAPSADVLLVAGPKGVQRSVDHGSDFTSARGPGLSKAVLIAFDAAGDAHFAYGKNAIYVSMDDGANWRRFAKPRRANSISSIDMVSARGGYLRDRAGELWRTTTAGRVWKRIETLGPTVIWSGGANAISFSDMKSGYFVDSVGRVLRTGDGGATWETMTFNDPMLVAAFSSIEALLLKRHSDVIFSTTTAGMTGSPSRLTLKRGSRRAKRNSWIKVTGRLSPAQAGETVFVVARATGAPNGGQWRQLKATVAANGTFSTRWKIRKSMIFVARWGGNGDYAADGSPPITVRVR